MILLWAPYFVYVAHNIYTKGYVMNVEMWNDDVLLILFNLNLVIE